MRERGRRAGVRALTVAMALAGLPASSSPSQAASDPPVRILLVGDSMTQGSAGDWTWRYRLWGHLTRLGVAFDFVGPRDGLFDNLSEEPHAPEDYLLQDYVDPEFDRDHAAKWGMALAFPEYSITDLMETYHPDVVVEMLGVNDLGFVQKTPEQVEDLLRDWVADARAVDPGIDLVLARLPQPWRAKVPELNTRVTALAAELSTASSPIVVADTDHDYLDEDTWDGAHPNSHGDLKIAAAMGDSLAALGIGAPVSRPLPLDDTPRGPRLPSVLSGGAGLRSAELTWTRSPGAAKAQLWMRDVTTGSGWTLAADQTAELTWTATDLPGWHEMQFKVLPIKLGWVAAPDVFSNVVRVQPLDDRLGPPRVSVSMTPSGVATLDWDGVPGATAYAVQWRTVDAFSDWASATTSGTSAVVTGLANMEAYVFRVRAQRGALASDFSAEFAGQVPGLRPARRARARVTRFGAVVTTANAVPDATSYTLRVAWAPTCVRTPAMGTFRVARVAQLRPHARLHHRAPGALWVRWVGVRGGVEGGLAPSSTACVRLRG